MKQRIFTLIFTILTSLSSFAEHDGKPWDDDSYNGFSIGPLIFGLIVIYLVFYLLPKMAVGKGKNKTQNHHCESKNRYVSIPKPALTKCPKCNGTGILYVERHICPYCFGLGREFDEPLKSKLLSLLKESDIIPDYIKTYPQDVLSGFSPLNSFDRLPLIFSLTREEHLKLLKGKICKHCSGIGSVNTKCCTCFFDENGNYTGHAGYIEL